MLGLEECDRCKRYARGEWSADGAWRMRCKREGEGKTWEREGEGCESEHHCLDGRRSERGRSTLLLRERAFLEVAFCEHRIQVPFALNRPTSSSSCAQNTHQVSPARAFAPRARDYVSLSGGDAMRNARRDVRVWRDAQWGRATHARTRRHRRGPAEPSSMNAKHYAHRGTLKARPRVHGSDGARCLSKPISSALPMLPSVP